MSLKEVRKCGEIVIDDQLDIEFMVTGFYGDYGD